jgi:DNA-binding transcriptional LysR family regulator
MGKLMVAEGLGLTVLPDFSVIGDPLEERGVIVWRPIEDDKTGVHLVIQRVRSLPGTRAVQDLHRIFVERAQAYRGAPATSGRPGGRPPGRTGRSRPGER